MPGKGDRHHRWNDERIISSHGYAKIRVGVEHPLADPNGYAYEHLVVWVSAGNPAPEKGFLLHHQNDQKSDNRLCNLECISRADHNRLHNAERDRDGRGRLLPKGKAA